MSKIYGYARCSTNEELQDIKRQIRELAAMGVDEVNIYEEYEHSTKTRKELNKVLAVLEQGDTLVATELTRITRSTKELIELIDFVKEKKVKLVLGSFVVDCRNDQLDAMTEGMLQMMGVFAELERKILSERVRSGVANARAKGKKLGRPKTTLADLPKQFLVDYYPRLQKKELSKVELSKITGWSRSTIDKWISVVKLNRI